MQNTLWNTNINTLYILWDFWKIWWMVCSTLGWESREKAVNSSFNVGLTPINLVGPKDQHSFLQLIVEGLRDKSITFLKIEKRKECLKIPDITLENLEEFDILNSLDFNSLINIQADSVIESLLSKKDIPIDIITLEKIDEYNIGKFIFYYELLTSLVAKLIGVDAYNQPELKRVKRYYSKIRE